MNKIDYAAALFFAPIIIIALAVMASATYCVIGNREDNAEYANFGFMLGAGIFALIVAILSACMMSETDITISVSVIIGVVALALSVGALASASIKH
uniref:Uncharacterized protein n=1 Tax=viral metagenome TaxID=1070528 RepID=A0A6C0JZL7_9ZZZZ